MAQTMIQIPPENSQNKEYQQDPPNNDMVNIDNRENMNPYDFPTQEHQSQSRQREHMCHNSRGRTQTHREQ